MHLGGRRQRPSPSSAQDKVCVATLADQHQQQCGTDGVDQVDRPGDIVVEDTVDDADAISSFDQRGDHMTGGEVGLTCLEDTTVDGGVDLDRSGRPGATHRAEELLGIVRDEDADAAGADCGRHQVLDVEQPIHRQPSRGTDEVADGSGNVRVEAITPVATSACHGPTLCPIPGRGPNSPTRQALTSVVGSRAWPTAAHGFTYALACGRRGFSPRPLCARRCRSRLAARWRAINGDCVAVGPRHQPPSPADARRSPRRAAPVRCPRQPAPRPARSIRSR